MLASSFGKDNTNIKFKAFTVNACCRFSVTSGIRA